jgi:hypothetical protein
MSKLFDIIKGQKPGAFATVQSNPADQKASSENEDDLQANQNIDTLVASEANDGTDNTVQEMSAADRAVAIMTCDEAKQMPNLAERLVRTSLSAEEVESIFAAASLDKTVSSGQSDFAKEMAKHQNPDIGANASEEESDSEDKSSGEQILAAMKLSNSSLIG